jgi:hypothetical protein
VRVCIGKHLEEIYVERSDEPYVDIFSLHNPSLLVRDPELEKNIVVKDFQTFMDRQISTDEKTDPLNFEHILCVEWSALARSQNTF